jgi:hypothetical protein
VHTVNFHTEMVRDLRGGLYPVQTATCSCGWKLVSDDERGMARAVKKHTEKCKS